MWLERLKVIAVLAGLIGFVAMLISVAWADRSAKKAIARGEDPKFSWAWFIFYLYLLAQGASLVLKEWINERHHDSPLWVNYSFKALAVLLLAIAITRLSNQIKWFVYLRRNRE
jgi:quinol-cytochrome oxidoreductase complex cytochrome b subunit